MTDVRKSAVRPTAQQLATIRAQVFAGHASQAFPLHYGQAVALFAELDALKAELAIRIGERSAAPPDSTSDAGATPAALAAEDAGASGQPTPTEVVSRAAARIAALESALHEVCENAYLTGTDPDWSPCAVKAEIIERARVVLGAPKP